MLRCRALARGRRHFLYDKDPPRVARTIRTKNLQSFRWHAVPGCDAMEISSPHPSWLGVPISCSTTGLRRSLVSVTPGFLIPMKSRGAALDASPRASLPPLWHLSSHFVTEQAVRPAHSSTPLLAYVCAGSGTPSCSRMQVAHAGRATRAHHQSNVYALAESVLRACERAFVRFRSLSMHCGHDARVVRADARCVRTAPLARRGIGICGI